MPISRRLPFNRADRRVRGTRASPVPSSSVLFTLRQFRTTTHFFTYTIVRLTKQPLASLRLTAQKLLISLYKESISAIGKKK